MDRLPGEASGPDPGRIPSDLCDYLGFGLHSEPLERLSLVHIVKSDNNNNHNNNVMVAKVILALSSITDEMQSLSALAKSEYFNPLLFYGEDVDEVGQAQVWIISRMLPILDDISAFGEHCTDVVENALGQLAALHDGSKGAKELISIGDSHFQVRLSYCLFSV